MMCRLLGVTRAGFYAWQARGPSQRQLDDAAITEQIRAVHATSLNTYGSPRVTQAMQQAGAPIGRRRVARLMRGARIQGRSARLYRRRRVGQKAFYKSIPNRQHYLQLQDTDQVWLGDVTYLRVRQQWRYMAVVMDKYSRRLLGWSHTDRGIEYGAYDYQAALRRHGIVQSMNRPGQMNDNAHMESFFHSLKSEFLWGKQFDSDRELRQTLHTYLQYYNHTRLHSSLEHTSPAAFERRTA